MNASLVPTELVVGAKPYRVRRVWQDLVEVVGQDGRIRGGRRSPDGSVELYPPGVDPDLPALEPISGQVVSHRPGKRAVVRTADGQWVKVVRPKKERRILEGIARAEPFRWSFRMPQVLSHGRGFVVFDELTGRSLGVGAGWSHPDWQQAWSEVLAAWVAAGAGPTGGDPAGSVHDAVAEVAVLDRWRGQAPDRALPDGFDALLRSVSDDLLTGVAAPLRVAHRDLHDKQLVWDRDLGPGLLDVDTATVAEAALDLGNLRAHARWRLVQGAWSEAQTDTVLRLVDDAAVRVNCPLERLDTYERATLLRLVCVHLHRPADRHLVPTLAAQVSSATTSALHPAEFSSQPA